jgi:hypothetical protein
MTPAERAKIWRSKNSAHVKEFKFADHLRRKFNITPDIYWRMYQEQLGRCAICNQYETTKRNGVIKNLAVDHCPQTNKIRQLLCARCNTALGSLRDNIETLQKAINYLHKHSQFANPVSD